VTEYSHNAQPMRPVEDAYGSASAHQANDRQLAREFTCNGQQWERFRDQTMPPARNRPPARSETAWMGGAFDTAPAQQDPGGYRLLYGEQGDAIHDNKSEVLRP
jgi:hypothetical protein